MCYFSHVKYPLNKNNLSCTANKSILIVDNFKQGKRRLERAYCTKDVCSTDPNETENETTMPIMLSDSDVQDELDDLPQLNVSCINSPNDGPTTAHASDTVDATIPNGNSGEQITEKDIKDPLSITDGKQYVSVNCFSTSFSLISAVSGRATRNEPIGSRLPCVEGIHTGAGNRSAHFWRLWYQVLSCTLRNKFS